MVDHIEAIARDLARTLIAVPGWASDVETLCATIREQARHLCQQQDGPPALAAMVDRAADILTDAATCGPEAFMTRYHDLLPADLRREMFSRARAVLHDSGVVFEEFKDETGETHLRVDAAAVRELAGSEALDAMSTMPVGTLTRVH